MFALPANKASRSDIEARGHVKASVRNATFAREALSRRDFVKISGVCAAGLATASAARASEKQTLDADRKGVLVDLTVCVGCRRCEWACNNANELPHGGLSDCDDQSVFDSRRRPTSIHLTVVNRVPGRDGAAPTFIKTQCMHCEHPACVSACLVGAMRKTAAGPVIYDASRCIGCRYCMVACPYQFAAYEYEKALTPQVKKCQLCQSRTSRGELPACVAMCPVEALTYGRRDELLKLAHERIDCNPDRYVNHVYGEHEGGGTSWLYLADRPFTELGFPELGPDSPAQLTETIQHGIFKGFAAPIMLFGLLGAIGKLSHARAAHTHAVQTEKVTP